MQLVQLLRRLSSKELQQLIARHGFQADLTDIPKIASGISQFQHVQLVLYELNLFQLTTLRWIAQEPKHQATWSRFLELLNGRVPEPILLTNLKELRLWGLADFEAKPKDGWIATYGAIATHPTITQGARLGESLARSTSDQLAKICAGLEIKPLPKTNLDRQRAIERLLTNQESLQAVLKRLSKSARELFIWFIERGGTADHQALAKKMGDSYYTALSHLTRMYVMHGAAGSTDGSALSDLLERGLIVSSSPYQGYGWAYASTFAVPSDIRAAYSGKSIFDTIPLTQPLLVTSEPTYSSVPNPSALVRDMLHLRAFIGVGRAEWKQDGEPYVRSLQTLGKLIKSRDKEYGGTLWDLSVQAPLVQPAGYPATGFEMVSMDGATPDAIISVVVQNWEDGDYSTDRRGTVTAGVPRTRVMHVLRHMPTDTWVRRDSFNDVMMFRAPLVFNRIIGGMDGTTARDWSPLYATILGHGRDAEGHEVFQVISSQLEIAFPESDDAPPKMPDWDETWVVQPDRTIMTPPNASPDSIFDAWNVAEITDNQGASIFRVTSDSVSGALNRGLAPDEIEDIFKRRSRTGIPATVERVIQDQGKRYGQIRVGSAVSYIHTTEPELLDELVRNAKLNKLSLRALAPTIGVIDNADEAAVLDTLKKAGYLPVSASKASPKSTTAKQPIPLDSARRRATIEAVIIQAIEEGALMSIRWDDPVHGLIDGVIDPESYRNGELLGFDVDRHSEQLIQLNRIALASLLSSKETQRYHP